ncbi:hypothetical protein GCE65_12570 [Pseudactinotalea sp. HY158]|nr:hypothetical protein GCE65_12570 [Pseudactinotalea sp. HY158]
MPPAGAGAARAGARLRLGERHPGAPGRDLAARAPGALAPARCGRPRARRGDPAAAALRAGAGGRLPRVAGSGDAAAPRVLGGHDAHVPVHRSRRCAALGAARGARGDGRGHGRGAAVAAAAPRPDRGGSAPAAAARRSRRRAGHGGPAVAHGRHPPRARPGGRAPGARPTPAAAPVGIGRPAAAGGGIAVCGAPEAAGSLARWLLGQLLLTRADVTFRVPPGWGLAGHATVPTSGTGPVAGSGGLHIAVTEDPAAPPRTGAVTIVVCPAASQAPRWCSRVIPVADDHDRRVRLPWLRHVLTLLPAAAGALPTEALLPAVLGPAEPDAIRRDWRDPPAGLAAPVGVRQDPDTGRLVPARVDLAAEGPHALVAGTTGSGKSELLLSWLLALARGHPPSRLSLILVDYKGGATFGELAGLPHVAGVLTDLDPPGTARALAGLRAEVQRRERLLAETGAADLLEHHARLGRGLPGTPLCRLLLVVDEFRAMSEEHPDVLDELVRLAAQGRSLGLHLVLATQRPGGAVGAEIRANIAVRLCLRVLEEGDSVDVLGEPGAARLPPVPGRFLLRAGTPAEVQSFWVGPPHAGYVPRLVAALTGAARATESGGAYRPWAPELPDRARALPPVAPWPTPAPGPPAPGGELPLLVVDVTDEQRLGHWALPAGEVLVVAGRRSGRTTAAATLARAALDRGVVTHLLGRDLPGPAAPHPAAPWLGTTGEAGDVVLARRLLGILTEEPRTRPELLVLDDAAALERAIDERLGPGCGAEAVTELLRSARGNGLGLVLTSELPLPRWAQPADHRLVLTGGEPDLQLLAGVPKAWAGHAPRGRGTLLSGGRAIRGQVLLPLEGPGPAGRVDPPPLRLRPVPALVDLPAAAARASGRAGWVVVGLGGDDAAPVLAPVTPGQVLTVVGGPGRGRTTAATTIGRRVAEAGGEVSFGSAGGRTPVAGGLLVLDDVDRTPAATLDEGMAWLTGGGAVVVTTRPDGLVSGFHPLLARARDGAMLVLGPVPAALTGVDVRPWLGGRRPGRGVLALGGRAIPVQVDRAGGSGGSSGSGGLGDSVP